MEIWGAPPSLTLGELGRPPSSTLGELGRPPSSTLGILGGWRDSWDEGPPRERSAGAFQHSDRRGAMK